MIKYTITLEEKEENNLEIKVTTEDPNTTPLEEVNGILVNKGIKAICEELAEFAKFSNRESDKLEQEQADKANAFLKKLENVLASL